MNTSHIDLYVLDDDGQFKPALDEDIIEAALTILDERLMRKGLVDGPDVAEQFLSLRLGGLEHEVFAGLFMDAQSRIIDYVELSHGSITETRVYPREVIKTALKLNAAAVIFAHNHPSGNPNPSDADVALTKLLVGAMDMIAVRVLDHIVIGGGAAVSFAEKGLL